MFDIVLEFSLMGSTTCSSRLVNSFLVLKVRMIPQ
jgi:hypothetical protein